MAIGTMAAIGLGLAGIGTAVGAASSSSAAKKSAQVAQQTSDNNNALAAAIYGQNQQALAPYMQRGNAAGDQINALLGIGGTTNSAGSDYIGQPTNALAATSFGGGYGAGYDLAAPKQYEPMAYYGQDLMAANGGAGYATAPTAAPQGQSPQQAQQGAFDTFKASTGYQSRLSEGMNALNSMYAGAGTIQSGAAMKAATRYGQDYASNEFGNYMGYLGNQQGVGLSGASALAGVGQNYANNVSANNNSAGTAQMNALMYRGANNPFAAMAGMVGGGLYGLGK